MKCPRCQQDNPLPDAQFCPQCGTPVRRVDESDTPEPSYADLRRELTEAREQQTAASDILQVIAQAPTDTQAVFETIVQNSARLCNAATAAVMRTDGRMLYLEANYGRSPEILAAARGVWPRPLDMTSASGAAILTRSVAQIPDSEDPSASEFVRQSARLVGYRSSLAVPILRGTEAIGAIRVTRLEPGRFSDTEVELLRTFADQAVIAIENVRLFKELEARNRELTEALDQQTATSEILRVISQSPTEVQPVFEALAKSAARLCGADDALIRRAERGALTLVAHFGGMRVAPEVSMPITRDMAVGCAVLDRRTIHVTDMEEEHHRGNYPGSRRLRERHGYRTLLCVPLVREDVSIGVIVIRRAEVQPFTYQQIDLAQTFADQAVIAIENVRLFKELEARNRELAEALDQQTATSEILRVISQSRMQVEPVFETVAASAAALCGAFDAAIFRLDGDRLLLVAHHGPISLGTIGEFTVPLVRGTASGRAVLDGRTIHVADLQAEAVNFPEGSELARREGHRTILSVPLMREGVAIGAITLRRQETELFTERQVALLKTFADQAVIAIENVRLFTELEEKNRSLTEAHARVSQALDHQTATAEILGVISQSPTDAQLVFETIARSALRLCEGSSAIVSRYDGELMHLAAHAHISSQGVDFITRVFPLRPSRTSMHGRAVLEGTVIHVVDVRADSDYDQSITQTLRNRSMLAVPMLRDGRTVGAIAIGRHEVRPFTDEQIALMQTFADQAVIAIENVRLFNELQARTTELARSVDELTALGEVGRALSSTLDLETVLTTIVNRAVQLSAADAGTILEYDEPAEVFHPRVSTEHPEVVAALRGAGLRKGEGAVGRMAVIRDPVEIPDIGVEGAYDSRVREALLQSGRRAVLALPLQREEHLIGGLVISRNVAGEFPVEIVELLKTFATQSALAIQNARLFREIEEKSRELEAASRHKSEFLANMSHELRTPLNAIIGFSEVLVDGMFGEVNEKQVEYLNDILESGRHLLSLINDILDLSKIEAGRMELEATDFDLPSAIDNALSLVRERAGRRAITLGREIDERLEMIRADERKVKQVLLNLLSNALKFTPEGGRIDVRAGLQDGVAEISVTDTGVGIAPEDQEAVFEEFRQVGTAAKKVEGTGLGLALSRRFIELHGGRIWVKSQVGQGSTFTFTLPLRATTP